MILFLVLTLFVALPYHVWEFSHRFLGPAFFVATLHAFIIRSDISRDSTLRAYMLVLVDRRDGGLPLPHGPRPLAGEQV